MRAGRASQPQPAGNIRELRNLLESGMLLTDRTSSRRQELAFDTTSPGPQQDLGISWPTERRVDETASRAR